MMLIVELESFRRNQEPLCLSICTALPGMEQHILFDKFLSLVSIIWKNYYKPQIFLL